MKVFSADDWSSNILIMHPTRLEFKASTFTSTERACLNRELLETERSFFGNTVDEHFSESGEDFDMSLSNREKELLIMDRRTCCSRIIFRYLNDWNIFRDKM